MSELSIKLNKQLVNDIISGKTNSIVVMTWPMSYKKFVDVDANGDYVIDKQGLCVPIKYDSLHIISTNGKNYHAKIDYIEVSLGEVPSFDKEGKEKVDKEGNPIYIPAILMFKENKWQQYFIEYTIKDILEVSIPETYIKQNYPSIIAENWEDYSNGRQGSKTIPAFKKAATPDVTIDEQVSIINQFDPNYMENQGQDGEEWIRKNLDDTYQEIAESANGSLPTTISEASDYYEAFNTLLDPTYRGSLNVNLFLTFNLYAWCPEFFFPNLFVMNFIALQRFFDKYNLDLPDVPLHTNWKGRCMYYMELCKILYQFRIDNDLSPAELCALMFQYAQRHVKQEKRDLPEPSQAWLIGGTSGETEKDADYRFWQASPDTKRGDILIHYEKFPVKAITAVWRAEENGIVDPFFVHYSNTYTGHKIDVPHITLDELKADEYFKNPNSTVGKLISKNFQGVNGWTVTGDDYKHFLEIWNSKGLDISVLPKLYAPELPDDIVLNYESDVSNNLLIPMLNAMGWKEHVDFEQQVPFKAGRGVAKRPDFCLHITGHGDDVKAKVIFECKYYMKNGHERKANFTQGRSYAKWGSAKVLVLCDKQVILVYRLHNGEFDQNKFKTFYWSEVMGANPDKFNELKKLLS